MKKYKIGNKVVYANSLHDALEIYKHKAKDSWTEAYDVFIKLIDKIPMGKDFEKKANKAVETEYAKHKGDPDWDEAYRRYKATDSKVKDEENVIYEVATAKVKGGRMDHEYFESKEELLAKYPGKDNGSVVKLQGFVGPFNNGMKNGKKVLRYEDRNASYMDSKTTDAKKVFEIRWIDQYQKSKGYDKTFWLNNDTIKADSVTEALDKLKGIAVMRGCGTRYITIVSIRENNTNYMVSGNIEEVTRKLSDSKVKDYQKADVQKIADYLWSWSNNDPFGWEARYIIEEGLNESNLTEANLQKGIKNAEKELDRVYAQLKQRVQQMLEAGYKGQKERIYKYADVLRKEDAYQK